MRLGDILEWLAAVAAITAAYLYAGYPLATGVGAVSLAYFAQCYDVPLSLPKRKPAPAGIQPAGTEERQDAVFHCAKCGEDSPISKRHECRADAA